MKDLSASEIIKFIGNANKKTPVKIYVKGQLSGLAWPANVKVFIEKTIGVVFGDWSDLAPFLSAHQAEITDYEIENSARNSAVPLLDLKEINARIEPGAIIRDQVSIGDNAVIMMGAVINIGAKVGSGAMIDMNAVLGGRAIIGNNAHVGAGAVIAGVIEPASAKPAKVGDNALIGANAVVLEGVEVGDGAVVAAGAVVTEDVEPQTVVAGVPARIIKKVDDKTSSKTGIETDLRKI